VGSDGAGKRELAPAVVAAAARVVVDVEAQSRRLGELQGAGGAGVSGAGGALIPQP
jgi:ornithine cyclodeaminase/alanine dehydrogenase-like protein (mu-crystallin family)